VNVLFERNLASLYSSLDDSHELKILLDNVASILKENIYAGAKVRKKHIPKYYIVTHGVHVIYRLRIEKCRIIYTLVPEGEGTNTLVLECFTDHKSYAKRFGYKT
jgi:mRNA-degrading endonuclease RelE of RelBE toxin-antitoxin system